MTLHHTSGPLRVDTYHGDNGKTELYRLQATVGITAAGILRRADADLYAAAPELLKVLRDVQHAWETGVDARARWAHKVRAAIRQATGE